ncbi:flocculation protein FLO11-like isoform X2 [Scyliorhinus canicula]|uniref:flocculation protein FLO11-like isoform X2 n=1 Tax=Scyliorhinus canicula TaxID=7830 RepID=UPI0018F45E18|nr:flocculation protein FLO11-like isoform X2 [Scyliorhinus canicula]
MSYASEELYKFICSKMPDYFIIKTVELLPHLSCLTQMDQEKIRAIDRNDGNEAAIPILFDSIRRRNNWETQIINALRKKEYYYLADDLEHKLESLAPRRNVTPNRAAANSSLVPAVPTPSAPVTVLLPQNPSNSITIADNSRSSPASNMPTHPSPNWPVLQPSAGMPLAQPSAGMPVVQPPAGMPVTQPLVGTPVVQPLAGIPVTQPSAGTPVTQPSAGTPVSQPSVGTPAVQPSAGTPVSQPSVGTPAVESSVGTPAVESSVGTPAVESSVGTPAVQPSAGTPAVQPSAGTPVVQRLAGTHVVPSSANIPAAHSSAVASVMQNPTVVSSPVPAPNLQPLALSVAPSSTSTALSSVSSTASKFTAQAASIEFKMPIQEIGKSVDSEENKDDKLPVQEKMVPVDHSQTSGSSRAPKIQTLNSDRNNSGEKREVKKIFTPNTDQAKRETRNNQAITQVPSTHRQVHIHRPLYQPNEDDSQDIGKPEILRSVVENVQSGTEAFSLSEGPCTVTSEDLQLSESTVANSRSNHSDSSPLFTKPSRRDTPEEDNSLSLGDSSNRGANASCDFNDKNSIKEQKIQALRGYQNDQRQMNFYDIHSPLNVQLNFDAEKKLSGADEGVDPDQKDVSNQNMNTECTPKAFQMSHTEIAQSVPALARTQPVDNWADSDVEFMKNVQINKGTDSISGSDQLLISSDTDCSFEGYLVPEPRVHEEQGFQNANELNNSSELRSFQVPDVQVAAKIGDVAASQKNVSNHTAELGCELEPNGGRNLHFDCSQPHENRFTGAESDNNSNLEGNTSKRDSSSSCAMSCSKWDTSPEVENTDPYNEDVKEHVGHIYQEPDYKNEEGNKRKLEATNLGVVYGHDIGDRSINALSSEQVPLTTEERSQARQLVNSKGDLPQSNYGLLSMSVVILSVVAACIWKYYRK